VVTGRAVAERDLFRASVAAPLEARAAGRGDEGDRAERGRGAMRQGIGPGIVAAFVVDRVVGLADDAV
jgi:hypothetical protein